jgi:alpha-N-arabinofuranosidase
MAFFSKALVAAVCVASALAVDIVVQSTGGNVTGKFGHPYGYGFLHEVRRPIPKPLFRAAIS